MCSIEESRLARIGEAIDEVARAALADRDGPAGIGELASRLADIWAMMAELDPALAASVPGYIRSDGTHSLSAEEADSAARPGAGG